MFVEMFCNVIKWQGKIEKNGHQCFVKEWNNKEKLKK